MPFQKLSTIALLLWAWLYPCSTNHLWWGPYFQITGGWARFNICFLAPLPPSTVTSWVSRKVESAVEGSMQKAYWKALLDQHLWECKEVGLSREVWLWSCHNVGLRKFQESLWNWDGPEELLSPWGRWPVNGCGLPLRKGHNFGWNCSFQQRIISGQRRLAGIWQPSILLAAS